MAGAHAFTVADWQVAGDSAACPFGGDVTTDGTWSVRAEGVYTRGGDMVCDPNVAAFERDLVGVNTARVYFAGADGADNDFDCADAG